jgi:hypothetical protein
MVSNPVDVKLLKAKAINFPEPIRTLILSEPDVLDSSEFITKLGTWEKLLRMEVIQK